MATPTRQRKVIKYRRSFKRFSALINRHVGKGHGITNVFLHRVLTYVTSHIANAKKKERKFLGVFPSNKIPSNQILKSVNAKKEKTLVVNLLPTDSPLRTGHFIFVHVTPKAVAYVDPFGPLTPEPASSVLERTLRKLSEGRTLRVNTQVIQDVSSPTCGLFTALFVIQTEADKSLKEFKWDKKNLKRNDEICRMYLQRALAKYM